MLHFKEENFLSPKETNYVTLLKLDVLLALDHSNPQLSPSPPGYNGAFFLKPVLAS